MTTEAQLDVGVLEHGLQPVGEPCPLVNQVDAVAREVAQVTLGRRSRNEAGAQQAMAQQIGQPLGILDIRLAARDRLGVVRIDDEDLALLLEQVEDRTPIRARRLHDHRPAVLSSQPIGERQQIVRHGAVGAYLLVDRPIWLRRQQARHDKLLVDIQATAALVQHPHDPSLLSVSP